MNSCSRTYVNKLRLSSNFGRISKKFYENLKNQNRVVGAYRVPYLHYHLMLEAEYVFDEVHHPLHEVLSECYGFFHEIFAIKQKQVDGNLFNQIRKSLESSLSDTAAVTLKSLFL